MVFAMKTMSIETVNILRSLITEKQDRLGAIARQLKGLRADLRGCTTSKQVNEVEARYLELREEADSLMSFINKAKQKVSGFYKPAA